MKENPNPKVDASVKCPICGGWRILRVPSRRNAEQLRHLARNCPCINATIRPAILKQGAKEKAVAPCGKEIIPAGEGRCSSEYHNCKYGDECLDLARSWGGWSFTNEKPFIYTEGFTEQDFIDAMKEIKEAVSVFELELRTGRKCIHDGL